MKANLQLLTAVLLLSSAVFASPPIDQDHGWHDKKHHHSVPEPGSTVMMTLTAGTLVGGMFVRRRMKSSVTP